MQRYSEDHVWVRLDGPLATVGLSRHAAEELGSVTFVELPPKGARLAAGGPLCIVESSKAAADIPCPVTGVVEETNSRLESQPDLLTASPEEDGWVCRLREVSPDDLAALMTPAQYANSLARGPRSPA